ncbi:hypothetical protein CY35_17G091300 [Sphagnum magellanicum]|nr:hypothetical protein CY35_17G091300 [Sphagnum magellanicum]
MGLYYNIQKSLLTIHQKTECLTSDPQCMYGNFYNVVILNLTQFPSCYNSQPQVRRLINPNWNWKLQN